MFLAATLWSGTCQAQDAEAVAAGRTIAEKLCARCHGIGQKDESSHKDAPLFRTFKQKWGSVEGLAEALAEGIFVGHPDMPEFVMKPEEIGNFLSYLETLGVEEP